jgi:hypothetical protein
MLHYTEYTKVNNSEEIAELKARIEKLQMIGGVSRDMTMYLESLERCESLRVVESIHQHSDGGCFIQLKESFVKISTVDMLQVLMNIWNKQSDKTKEEVSISFSGDRDYITGIQVFWRKSLQSDNDISLLF